MFDIGWSELLVIGIVALIAIGPKELPGVLRAVGQWMGKIRRMASEFQGQFQEAMREAEMDDLKKQVDEMTSVATDVTNFDPIGSVRKEVEGAFEDKPAPSEPPSEPSTSSAGASPEAAASATPAPVAPDAAAEHDLALAPQAPQPKAGSGA